MIRRAKEGERIYYYPYDGDKIKDTANSFEFDSHYEEWHAFIDENNFLHNYLNEPAYIKPGSPYFFQHGKAHRTNGPAIPLNSFDNKETYCLNGIEYTKEDYYSLIMHVDEENVGEVVSLGDLF